MLAYLDGPEVRVFMGPDSVLVSRCKAEIPAPLLPVERAGTSLLL